MSQYDNTYDLCPPGWDWTMLTKRTNDPKLAYIEHKLDEFGIKHRRSGESFHAPILEVQDDKLDEALKILDEKHGRYTLDDIRDDNPKFNKYMRR